MKGERDAYIVKLTGRGEGRRGEESSRRKEERRENEIVQEWKEEGKRRKDEKGDAGDDKQR